MASDALVITGPTAVGKTAIGILVAKRLGAEIVSMDSRQVYRGMDIGTAKPTLAEREGIPHFGFDLVSPAERYSAGRFARDAKNWIAGIRERGPTTHEHPSDRDPARLDRIDGCRPAVGPPT